MIRGRGGLARTRSLMAWGGWIQCPGRVERGLIAAAQIQRLSRDDLARASFPTFSPDFPTFAEKGRAHPAFSLAVALSDLPVRRSCQSHHALLRVADNSPSTLDSVHSMRRRPVLRHSALSLRAVCLNHTPAPYRAMPTVGGRQGQSKGEMARHVGGYKVGLAEQLPFSVLMGGWAALLGSRPALPTGQVGRSS
jgi:hypothetical protein